MRNKTLIGAAALAALFPATQFANAADADGNFSVEGPGSLTCQQMTAVSTGSEQFGVVAGYVSGYLSAHNKLMQQTYDLTPWQSLELSVGQIRTFCEANPELRVSNGLDQYINFLRDNRLEQSEERLSLTVNERTVFLYASTVERVREKLAEQGIAPESSDPLAGLKLFQEQAGLEPTGLPDQRTLLALFGEAR